ncbi:CopG family transcriptional regulator [Sphingomonas sp. HH69]
MHEDDDDAFADNHAERAQAKALREQARAGGLRFEAYLTGDQADWLLERVERGLFHDPSEAVFAIVGNFIELEPHRDLRDELLRRMLDVSAADLESARPADEVFDELRQELAKPRPEPARWEKIAR